MAAHKLIKYISIPLHIPQQLPLSHLGHKQTSPKLFAYVHDFSFNWLKLLQIYGKMLDFKSDHEVEMGEKVTKAIIDHMVREITL